MKPTLEQIQAAKVAFRKDFDPPAVWAALTLAEQVAKGEVVLEQPWQPIETAPRDGTVFDVYGRWGRQENCVRCKQFGRIYQYCEEQDGYTILLRDGEVTHWKPLPRPPQEASDERD